MPTESEANSTTPKNKGGRPKAEADRKRNRRLDINWIPGELDRVSEVADALGLSVAAYVRHATMIRVREDLSRMGRS